MKVKTQATNICFNQDHDSWGRISLLFLQMIILTFIYPTHLPTRYAYVGGTKTLNLGVQYENLYF